jgi:hypothetical protein
MMAEACASISKIASHYFSYATFMSMTLFPRARFAPSGSRIASMRSGAVVPDAACRHGVAAMTEAARPGTLCRYEAARLAPAETATALYLNSRKLNRLKKGTAVLRENVGTAETRHRRQ